MIAYWKVTLSGYLGVATAQKEKIFRGSRKLPQAHEKVCDENERRRRRRKKTTRA